MQREQALSNYHYTKLWLQLIVLFQEDMINIIIT